MIVFSLSTASLHHHWQQQIFQWNPPNPHQQRSSPFPHHHLIFEVMPEANQKEKPKAIKERAIENVEKTGVLV